MYSDIKYLQKKLVASALADVDRCYTNKKMSIQVNYLNSKEIIIISDIFSEKCIFTSITSL